MSGRTISGQGKGQPPWRLAWRSILRELESGAQQPGDSLPAQGEAQEQEIPRDRPPPVAGPGQAAAAGGIRLQPVGPRAGHWAVLVRRLQSSRPEAPAPLQRVLTLKRPLGALRIRQQVPRLRLVYRPLLPQPLSDRRALPVALRLPALHALLSFVFLALLPQHPLSIPTALGLAFGVVVYIQVLAYGEGYGFRQ
jgi:hypothetical protein